MVHAISNRPPAFSDSKKALNVFVKDDVMGREKTAWRPDHRNCLPTHHCANTLPKYTGFS